jgi:lincosamide nucleotidyltransferase A/C/D/E
MVYAEDVVSICKLLSSNGIQVWLTSGWGVDALLGLQTRSHHDLDVIMQVDDVTRLLELMGHQGYTYKELWEENLWTVDTQGTRIETAFFLRDPDGREFDAHAMRLDERGDGIPAWEKDEGFYFTPQDLVGKGLAAGYAVRCQSAENQMICHTGYALPDKQVPDLKRLHEKFGVAYPEEISQQLRPIGI